MSATLLKSSAPTRGDVVDVAFYTTSAQLSCDASRTLFLAEMLIYRKNKRGLSRVKKFGSEVDGREDLA